MPPGTTLRNFRCDACAAKGTDASKQLRALIDGWLTDL